MNEISLTVYVSSCYPYFVYGITEDKTKYVMVNSIWTKASEYLNIDMDKLIQIDEDVFVFLSL